MRRKLVVGNWKMNKLKAEARSLLEAIAETCAGSGRTEVVVCPPFVFLDMALSATNGTPIGVGAQNAFHEESGAYTGEVSPPMLRDMGCAYVILGHSERRAYFGEEDALINRKAKRCISSGLKPILCVGETLAQRKEGATFDVLNGQVVYGLEGIDNEHLMEMVIAYEPVWAIGTGMSASSAQAEEAHRHIRRVVEKFSSRETAAKLRIIYGGSVTPGNASSLLREGNIDGALVGGASLNADTFRGIVEAAESAAG